jgi:hypothetical protein
MKVYVHEPQGTEHITNILKYSINKYWSNNIDLNIIKFSNEYRSPEFWADDFYNYFSNIDDDFFILILNDMILMSDVDTELLKKLEMHLDNSVGRIGLTKDIESRVISILDDKSLKVYQGWFYVNDNIIELYQNVNYRLSLINSIWNRMFFLNYLKDVKTPWEFETQPQNDNYRILGSKGHYVMNLCHMLSKGKINDDWNYSCFSSGKMCDDDYIYIKNQLNIPN